MWSIIRPHMSHHYSMYSKTVLGYFARLLRLTTKQGTKEQEANRMNGSSQWEFAARTNPIHQTSISCFTEAEFGSEMAGNTSFPPNQTLASRQLRSSSLVKSPGLMLRRTLTLYSHRYLGTFESPSEHAVRRSCNLLLLPFHLLGPPPVGWRFPVVATVTLLGVISTRPPF